MRIEDRLDKDTRSKLNSLRYTTPRKKKKAINLKEEKFSDRDIEDLIEIYQPTYRRHRGACRLK